MEKAAEGNSRDIVNDPRIYVIVLQSTRLCAVYILRHLTIVFNNRFTAFNEFYLYYLRFNKHTNVNNVILVI